MLPELKDWAFGNALWIFIGMVITVMVIGPLWLRRQFRKNPTVQITFAKSLIVSFLSGVISIVMFYGILIVSVLLFVGLASRLFNASNVDYIFEIAFVVIFLSLYPAVFHLMVRYQLIYWGNKLPPIPSENPARSEAEIQCPPKHKMPAWKERIREFIEYPIKWKTGWHLTVMCAASTIIFFFCFPAQGRERSMEAYHATNLRVLAKAAQLYESKYEVYPADMGDLVNDGYGSTKMFYTDTSGTPSCENKKFKAPSYMHCNSLRNDAPGDVLWIWFDPQEYYYHRMPVVHRNGEVKIISKKELPALIERSRKWLADHPAATATDY